MSRQCANDEQYDSGTFTPCYTVVTTTLGSSGDHLRTVWQVRYILGPGPNDWVTCATRPSRIAAEELAAAYVSGSIVDPWTETVRIVHGRPTDAA